MSKMSGVVTGVVKSVDDPDQQGRVQVSFPFLGGQNDSDWAPVATLMSGNGRGSWFMPEVGDEVLCAFNQDDVAHPFIIGFLWNGQDQPPVKGPDISTKVRRLRTVSGHQIDFDDNDGKESITIQTHGQHKIVMDDTQGSTNITISTSGGQTIQMEDTTPSITIKTFGENKITVSDVPPGLTISVPTGTINVNCLEATVTASAVMTVTAAALNVSAPITIFDGVVQAQTLIADAVVGSAYTPAPGNTFGL
jgi:uncharacterized protein involved in type VI secretion and phage assembly